MKILCVWLYVADIERAKQFYSGKLGMLTIREDHRTGWIEFLPYAESPLTLACQEFGKTPETSKEQANTECFYAAYISRVVIGVESLDSALAQLARQGLEPIAVRQIASVRFANFQDPDGNLLQLTETLISSKEEQHGCNSN